MRIIYRVYYSCDVLFAMHSQHPDFARVIGWLWIEKCFTFYLIMELMKYLLLLLTLLYVLQVRLVFLTTQRGTRNIRPFLHTSEISIQICSRMIFQIAIYVVAEVVIVVLLLMWLLVQLIREPPHEVQTPFKTAQVLSVYRKYLILPDMLYHSSTCCCLCRCHVATCTLL